MPGNSLIVRDILLTKLWEMEAIQRGLARGIHLYVAQQRIKEHLNRGEDITTIWQD